MPGPIGSLNPFSTITSLVKGGAPGSGGGSGGGVLSSLTSAFKGAAGATGLGPLVKTVVPQSLQNAASFAKDNVSGPSGVQQNFNRARAIDGADDGEKYQDTVASKSQTMKAKHDQNMFVKQGMDNGGKYIQSQ